MEINKTIKIYSDLGFSFVPSTKEKSPAIAWKEFQQRRPTPEEIETWSQLLEQDPTLGISIVCGKISNNLLLIDFDNKDPQFIKATMDTDIQQIAQNTWVSETPHGYHIHYLVESENLENKNYILLGSGENKKEVDLKGEAGLSKEPPSPGYANLSSPMQIAKLSAVQYKEIVSKLELLAKHKKYIERTLQEWKPGRRALLTLAFSGFCKKILNLSLEDALKVIGFISTMAQDEEASMRRMIITETYSKNVDDIAIHNWAKQAQAEGWLDELYKMHKTDREKPAIEQPREGRPISEFAKEIGKYYSDKTRLFYRIDTKSVVTPAKIAIKQENHEDVWIDGLVDVDAKKLVTFLEEDLNIYVWTEITVKDETGETKKIKVPKSKSISTITADIVLKSDQFLEQLPKITTIYTVPIPRLIDGKLEFPQKGYDERFLSYTFSDAPEIDPNMPLDKAKETIDFIYLEFAFKDEQDRTNAIAHLLTPFVRGLFSRSGTRTPLFVYMANRERSGKDYCANVVSIVYQGEGVEDPPISKKNSNDEEFRKKILSAFRMGRAIIHSSNNKEFLDSAELEALVTKETFVDRLLGTNTEARFSNNLTISLSANTGLGYSPDIKYRSVFINFEVDIEDPNQREFRNPDLHGWIKEHRAEVLSALYAFVREWVNAGMPACSKPFASFPEWMKITGGILEHVGYGAPAMNENADNAEIAGDKDEKLMRAFYTFCYNRWPEQWVERSEIFSTIANKDLANEYHPPEDAEEIFDTLNWGVNERSAETRLGLLMKKFKNRILNGIQMQVDEDKNRASRSRYFFKKADSKNNVASQETKTDNQFVNVVNVVNVSNSVILREGDNSKIFDGVKKVDEVDKVDKPSGDFPEVEGGGMYGLYGLYGSPNPSIMSIKDNSNNSNNDDDKNRGGSATQQSIQPIHEDSSFENSQNPVNSDKNAQNEEFPEVGEDIDGTNI